MKLINLALVGSESGYFQNGNSWSFNLSRQK